MAAVKNAPRTRKRVDAEAEPETPKRSKASSKSNPPSARKKAESETISLKRANDGSAFTKCEECKKDVPVVLIDMHNCSLESKIKMKMESMVVEKVVEVKKSAEKKTVANAAPKAKKSKKSSDPNMPKKPQTAFFLFMADFRKTFKEEHPDNKSVAVVGKEAGEKWKNLSEEEKKVYLDRNAKLKEEYEKAMEKFKSGDANGTEQGPESDKEDAEPEKEEDIDNESENEE